MNCLQDVWIIVKNIQAHIGAVELLHVLWLELSGKWEKEAQGFVLDPATDVELYDKGYGIIQPYQQVDAIASFFFSMSGKGNALKFKAGSSALAVYLCIKQDVYAWFEAHRSMLELAEHSADTEPNVS